MENYLFSVGQELSVPGEVIELGPPPGHESTLDEHGQQSELVASGE